MSSKALTDKIMQSAQSEAQKTAAEIMDRALESEKLILQRAKDECDGIIADAEAKAASNVKAASLVAGLDGRKALLHAKRQVIDKAFDEAKSRVLALDGQKRLEYLVYLIVKYAPCEEIELTVNENDGALLSNGCISNIEASLSERFNKPARVTLSDTWGDFSGGVYMTGAAIDVNATYEAVFAEVRSKSEAEIAGILFA